MRNVCCESAGSSREWSRLSAIEKVHHGLASSSAMLDSRRRISPNSNPRASVRSARDNPILVSAVWAAAATPESISESTAAAARNGAASSIPVCPASSAASRSRCPRPSVSTASSSGSASGRSLVNASRRLARRDSSVSWASASRHAWAPAVPVTARSMRAALRSSAEASFSLATNRAIRCGSRAWLAAASIQRRANSRAPASEEVSSPLVGLSRRAKFRNRAVPKRSTNSARPGSSSSICNTGASTAEATSVSPRSRSVNTARNLSEGVCSGVSSTVATAGLRWAAARSSAASSSVWAAAAPLSSTPTISAKSKFLSVSSQMQVTKFSLPPVLLARPLLARLLDRAPSNRSW